jgi:hypothetical protein
MPNAPRTRLRAVSKLANSKQHTDRMACLGSAYLAKRVGSAISQLSSFATCQTACNGETQFEHSMVHRMRRGLRLPGTTMPGIVDALTLHQANYMTAIASRCQPIRPLL